MPVIPFGIGVLGVVFLIFGLTRLGSGEGPQPDVLPISPSVSDCGEPLA